LLLVHFLQPGEEVLPDLVLLWFAQVLVVQGELNPGFKGFVKCSDSVRCEYQNTFVVLENAEEYRCEGIPVEVSQGALL